MENRSVHPVSGLTAAAVLSLVLSLPATGQAARTWGSVNGNDANDRGRATPCRTLSGALAKSAPGGEIDVLDSYGNNIVDGNTVDGTSPAVIPTK